MWTEVSKAAVSFSNRTSEFFQQLDSVLHFKYGNKHQEGDALYRSTSEGQRPQCHTQSELLMSLVENDRA